MNRSALKLGVKRNEFVLGIMRGSTKEVRTFSHFLISFLLQRNHLNIQPSPQTGELSSHPLLPSLPCHSSSFLLVSSRSMGRFQEYQVIGRKLPSEKEPQPKLYRMRIFAPNDVVAESRFWYFLRKLRKVKKATGEVVAVNVVRQDLFRVKVFKGNLFGSSTLVLVCRSARRSLSKSRTLASGFVTTRALEPTICTKSSVSFLEQTQSTLVTRIWLPVTVLVSARSKFVFSFALRPCGV